MASSLIPGNHVMSDLLTIRERGVLFALLGVQCKLIQTTVAQVLVSKETQGGGPGWSFLGCGAVCLIEDKSIHTHFLRLYCVKHSKLLWEQELYIPFKYTETRTFFHTFPADGNQVGLNFANNTDAKEFLLAVEVVKRNQGPVSQSLPRAAGASISLALKKGPLPPVPSIKASTTSQLTPQCTDALHQSKIPPQIPPSPPTPAPVPKDKIRKSARFKAVHQQLLEEVTLF